jgi:hypothetical protein
MFALIDTKGATHIAIHVPNEGADKSLPALIGMLEKNSTFIKNTYSSLETVTPTTNITLGDKVTCDNSYCDMIVTVPESDQVVGEGFVLADTAVYVSNAKARERADNENSKLRKELEFLKAKLQEMESTIASLNEGTEGAE